jgi:hypothetical protein
MNKISIVLFGLLIILATPFKAISQHQIGVSFGYGIPYYKVKAAKSNTTIEYQPNHAFITEITYKKRWPGIFNFGGDLNFINRNIQIDVDQPTLNADVYTSNSYSLYLTNIDAFAEFKFGTKIKYYLQIGPALSFMVFSQEDGYTQVKDNNGSGQTVTTYHNGNAQDIFPIINSYLYTGAGIDIPINDQWYISGKFQYQYEMGALSNSSENSYYNRSIYFQLGATYILPGLDHK